MLCLLRHCVNMSAWFCPTTYCKILTACRMLQISIAHRQMKAKIHSFPTMYILGGGGGVDVAEMGQIKVFVQELGLKTTKSWLWLDPQDLWGHQLAMVQPYTTLYGQFGAPRTAYVRFMAFRGCFGPFWGPPGLEKWSQPWKRWANCSAIIT